MTAIRVLLSRILAFALRRQRDERLDEEIRTHLDLLTHEYMARGLSRGDAARAARHAFGHVEAARETVRDQRGLPALDTAVQDTRLAIRLLRRDSGFVATSVVVLSIGIGVNSMLFTILNAHTLRGLPIPRAERVASISTVDESGRERGVSYPEFQDVRTSAHSFSTLVGFTELPVIVSGDNRPAERLGGLFVSGHTASITGIGPLAGRDFGPDDDRPGAPGVVMITTTAWRSRFGGDPAIIGHSILVNGVPATIVGVLDARSGLPVTAQVWLPFSMLPGLESQPRTERNLTVLARLHDEVAFHEAAAEIHVIGQRLSKDHPDTTSNIRTRATPINERYFGRWNQPVWLAFMATGVLVVLISAANVANLMLSRMARRARELAIRSSLGASRGRLVRQLLIEGTVLAGAGGAAGLAVAAGGIRLFRSAIPEDALPYWIDYSPDVRVLAALLLVSAATLLVFALLPAIKASRTDFSLILKDGGRSATTRGSHRWATAFLAAEFALSMVLLAHMAASLRGRRPNLPSDEAIATARVLTASVTLPEDRYRSADQRVQFYRLLDERLRGVQDIESQSAASVVPLMGGPEAPVEIQGRASDGENPPTATIVSVWGPFFETLGLPPVRGRELIEGDRTDGSSPIVVNQQFVQRYLADVDPIGHRIAIVSPGSRKEAPAWSTIVGVAVDVRQRPRPEPAPVVYLPFSRNPAATATLLIRGRGADAAVLASRVKEEVSAIDPHLPLYRVRTMRDLAWDARWNGRVSHGLILTLTLIAAALAAVGLYAVTMYSVRQRTQELGIRMALGAGPVHVAATVLGRAAVQLGLGFGAGILCIRAWDALLPGASADVSAGDPQSLLIVGAVLAVLAVAACSLPAARAVRLDPVSAIRHE